MDVDKQDFEPIAPDLEPGMNLISADFDLVMVNRPNERLYGKPMVELLGKKCYREFEKRDEPCPHCPGRLALATGEAHEAETVGVRDDGTRFAARVRAHPVQGPDNQPTGFIEVVEDITEEKRAESVAAIDNDLRSGLASTQNVSKALRQTLEAALLVEGIDRGCVFMTEGSPPASSLVLERGLTPESLNVLEDLIREWAEKGRAVPPEATARLTDTPGGPRAIAVVPVLHRGQVVAVLAAGTAAYPEIPPSLRAGLSSLGATASNAVSRILAERSRGDAVANLEAFITAAPLATWALDSEGRVTMWNRAAERLMGWQASEVLDAPPPFSIADDRCAADECSAADSPDPAPDSVTLVRRDGEDVEVRLVTAPFRDVVGDASTTLVMAEDLTLERRLARLERRLASASADYCPPPAEDVPASRAGRVLVIDADRARGAELAGIVCSLGYEPVQHGSVDEATAAIAGADAVGRPFVLAIVELLSADRSTGMDQKATLRAAGLLSPIVVCGDAEIRGHQQHGFAGAIRRPYDAAAIGQVLRAVL